MEEREHGDKKDCAQHQTSAASTAGKGLGEEGEHGDKRDCAHHQTDSQCSRERVGGRGAAWGQDGLLVL